jgi:hypothetical protein
VLKETTYSMIYTQQDHQNGYLSDAVVDAASNTRNHRKSSDDLSNTDWKGSGTK